MSNAFRPARSGLFFVCLLPLLFVSGCATTVRPVQESSERLAALQEVSESQSGRKLEDLGHDELIARGASFFSAGNDQMARLHFAMALKKMPTSVPALMGLGGVFQRIGDHGRAVAFYGQVVETQPGHAQALAAMGISHREQGNQGHAEEYLQRALASRPGDPALLAELAITFDRGDKEALAEPLHRQVAALQPRNATALNNLGFNLLLQKKEDLAVEALQQALLLAPRDKRIVNNLALALALRGDEERAFSLLSGSVGKAGAWNNLGYIYMSNGHYDKAEKAFVQAMEEHSRYYVRARENLDRVRLLSASRPAAAVKSAE